MKKAVWLIVGIIIILAVLVVSLGSSDKPNETGPIKIGASLPMTGEAASYGEQAKAGIDLAVKEINDAGGVNGRMLEVVIEDDTCASKGGSVVFSKLVNVDKVTAIVGPVCSAAGSAGLPLAQQGGVPTIVWGSAPNLTKIGDYIFRTYPSDSFQGVFVAEVLKDKMDKSKAAVIYVKNDYGQGLKDSFSAKFKALGGEVVFDEGIAQDSKDVRTVLTKMKSTNPDVLYMPVYPANGVVLAKELKNLGIKITAFGGDALDTDEVLSVKEAEGIMYVLGKFNQPEEFKSKIKNTTGKDSGLMTPLGYDSVKILSEIMEEAGTDRSAIRSKLASLEYTKAVALPLISFDDDGDLKTANYEVRVIKNGKSAIAE